MKIQKGQMRADDLALPYSKKSLEALANTLKIHRSLVWLDPVTGSLSVKKVGPMRQEEAETKEEG